MFATTVFADGLFQFDFCTSLWVGLLILLFIIGTAVKQAAAGAKKVAGKALDAAGSEEGQWFLLGFLRGFFGR